MTASMRDATCGRCETRFFYPSNPSDDDYIPETCEVCNKLGDRSLLWYLGAMRDAESPAARAAIRVRFDAAKGRSRM